MFAKLHMTGGRMTQSELHYQSHCWLFLTANEMTVFKVTCLTFRLSSSLFVGMRLSQLICLHCFQEREKRFDIFTDIWSFDGKQGNDPA
jgi:hypothetical protein